MPNNLTNTEKLNKEMVVWTTDFIYKNVTEKFILLTDLVKRVTESKVDKATKEKVFGLIEKEFTEHLNEGVKSLVAKAIVELDISKEKEVLAKISDSEMFSVIETEKDVEDATDVTVDIVPHGKNVKPEFVTDFIHMTKDDIVDKVVKERNKKPGKKIGLTKERLQEGMTLAKEVKDIEYYNKMNRNSGKTTELTKNKFTAKRNEIDEQSKKDISTGKVRVKRDPFKQF